MEERMKNKDMKNKYCCEYHNRLNLKFPIAFIEEDMESMQCGWAKIGKREDSYCCNECPDLPIIRPQKRPNIT